MGEAALEELPDPEQMTSGRAHPLLRPFGGVRQMVGGAAGLHHLWGKTPTGARRKQCYVPFLGPLCLPFRLIRLRLSR